MAAGPNTSPMRFSDAGLTLLVVVGLSGCGGTGGSSASGGAAATVTSTAAVTNITPTSAPATTTPTTTGTSATPTGPPPCRAAGLALSAIGQQGATGHGELGFAIRNTSASRCSTVGYPGVQFLDRAGAALPTTPTRTTSDFFGPTPERRLVLSPGHSASFRLGVTHGAGSSTGCATAYGLHVIAPNDTVTLRVRIPGGAFECATTTVSPMASGVSAYP